MFKGIVEYGCFPIGSDGGFAVKIFSLLEGTSEISEGSMITMDLVKWEDGIPYPMILIHCTYEQLAVNVKLITKELFKYFNLEN
ncbi:hypothetical protein SAMN06297358_1236 [Pedobacter xixiisoli]|uniref:Uncharacterized protein n=2 Tax=Pedobacter xixiisoli TaxID=1476464 RepID=A0A285ZVW5_9SPHI|nr:hypothetical protein SAMN06297358_1236 [Pedobacter xixiisoli]